MHKQRFRLNCNFIIITLFLFLNVAYVSGFESYEEEQNTMNVMKEEIGKQYWVLPNRDIYFYEKYDASEISNLFYVTDDISSFIVQDVVSHRSGYYHYYKIMFESGKIAYISKDDLDKKEYIKTEEPKKEKQQRKERQANYKALINSKIGERLLPKYKGDNIEKVFR